MLLDKIIYKFLRQKDRIRSRVRIRLGRPWMPIRIRQNDADPAGFPAQHVSSSRYFKWWNIVRFILIYQAPIIHSCVILQDPEVKKKNKMSKKEKRELLKQLLHGEDEFQEEKAGEEEAEEEESEQEDEEEEDGEEGSEEEESDEDKYSDLEESEEEEEMEETRAGETLTENEKDRRDAAVR